MIMASGTEIGTTLFGGAIKTQEWQENANNLQLIFVHCMFFVGSVVGGFNAGYFIDSIGRRPTLVRPNIREITRSLLTPSLSNFRKSPLAL